MRNLIVALFALALGQAAFGFGQPQHSSVAVDVRDGAEGKQFSLKINPNADMKVTLDAPWKLEVKGHDGLTLAKTTYGKADMDEKLPGFVLTAKADKASGDLEYTLTSFICTKDKTQCFREVHSGKQAWTAAK